MLRLATRSLLKRHSVLFEQKSRYIRGYWPEPITQTTLEQFLKDINYFDEHTRLIDIGLQYDKRQKPSSNKTLPDSTQTMKTGALEDLITNLSSDVKPSPLDPQDAKLSLKMMVKRAIDDGIYRDLFARYESKRDHIKFTREQANRMDRLVPDHWITDAPHSRVDPDSKELEPLPLFTPIVDISARFINHPSSPGKVNDEQTYAHISYHGNIIPACEALQKPAITLDGSLLCRSNDKFTRNGDNWEPGAMNLINFDTNSRKFFTVILVNLDYLHLDKSNLHWMITNIHKSSDDQVHFEETMDYLPVHGIQGFGYSRYVFLVFQHDSLYTHEPSSRDKLSLQSRKFDAKAFIHNQKAINMTPVGMSWFQTSWDHSSNQIFHDYLNLKAPVFDYVQPVDEKREMKPYPGRIPFNIHLDHARDKKEINEQVLLERLKSIDVSSSYKSQYVPPRVPPTVFQDEISQPHWMKNITFKKLNRVGYWRGLRPASALLPLDNNADLDHPIRPIVPATKAPPGEPNEYRGRPKIKSHKDMPTSKPVEEHQAVYIQDSHEIHLESVRKMMEEFQTKKDEKHLK